MENSSSRQNFSIRSLVELTIGLTLIFLLSFPASADAVLEIQVTESMSLTDEYDGVTFSQGTPTAIGTIEIKNNMSSTDLHDISLNFSKGSTSSWTTSKEGVFLNTGTQGYVDVHINTLEAGDSAIINYDCLCTRPINLVESYDSEKVIVGGAAEITLNLEKNLSVSKITNIRLEKIASDNNQNSTSDFIFSDEEFDIGAVNNDGSTLIWTVPELNSTSPQANLSFISTENDEGAHSSGGVQSSMKYYLGNTTLQFTINNGVESSNGVEINGIPTATASNIEITLQKKQLTDGEGGDGNDWGFTPAVKNNNTEPISYTLSTVNLYVTNTTYLNETSAINSTTNEVGTEIDSGSTWTGTEWKVYNFPDPVPVGWVDVDLSLDFSNTQFSQSYLTNNGTYKLIEMIYIINGYLVEAKKSIVNNETNANQYDITLSIHNKGNLATPPTVVVYDIIPTNFSSVYWETEPQGNTPIITPVTGMAYWWNIGALQPNGTTGDQVYIHYTVAGQGENYKLTDLFILGIDPSYSLNMQSTPVLKTGTLAASNSGGRTVISIMILGALFLGTLGIKKKK